MCGDCAVQIFLSRMHIRLELFTCKNISRTHTRTNKNIVACTLTIVVQLSHNWRMKDNNKSTDKIRSKYPERNIHPSYLRVIYKQVLGPDCTWLFFKKKSISRTIVIYVRAYVRLFAVREHLYIRSIHINNPVDVG